MTSISDGHADGAKDQAVVNCFDALLAAIRRCADDWRLCAAEANLDCDDTRAQECRIRLVNPSSRAC